MIIFSIIIPTYNRLHDVEEALVSILNQSIASESYELIIIDSGTKNIEFLTQKFKKNSNVHFILNAEKGASVQRNIGIEKAKGENLVFLDDDAIVDKNWLESYKEYFHLPDWGVLAGRIEPLWGENVKNYHKNSDFIKNMYSLFDLGENVREIDYGFSCNYLIKKEAFDQVGGFDLKIGRIGDDRILYGEDVLVCEAIKQTHINYYIPNATVFHKVHNYRLTWKWLISRAYAGGLTKAILNRKPKPYKKMKLSFYDYLLIIPYLIGYIKGKLGKNEDN